MAVVDILVRHNQLVVGKLVEEPLVGSLVEERQGCIVDERQGCIVMERQGCIVESTFSCNFKK